MYNPVGPSVSWSRLYNSLRGTQQGYQSNDLGQSWSHVYNLGVVATITTVGASKTATCALIEPNGAQVTLTTSQVPSAATPRVTCGVPAGYPMLAEWDYNSATGGTYFVFTHPDRTKWITLDGNSSPFNQSGTGGAAAAGGFSPNIGTSGPSVQWFALGQIADRNANAITFRYTSPTSGFPLLTSIVDKNSQALLTVTRDANNVITHVDDRYGRSVYYHVGTYATANVPAGHPQSLPELDHVSQVVLTGTASPPDRYVYGYQNVGNGEGSETVPMLHTITVPSPTGTGTQTATINYASNATIASLVDANGNSRSYTQPDANHTQVIIKNPQGNIVYRYTAGYDMNMSLTTLTNGAVDANGHNTQIVQAKTYADPNDPYRPSQMQDGNGYAAGGANGKGTWTYTWDQYGNCLTTTTPRETQTTNTFVYTNFALGELTKTQTAGKQAATFAYYEPSGNLQSVISPLPGTVNSNQSVTTSYTYSTLGNLLTVTTPGNNSTLINGVDQGIRTTYAYTQDGAYTQSEALGNPITITDNRGKIFHVRYDNQGRPVSVVDPLGNQRGLAYNIVGQTTQVQLPATGQTGSGTSYLQSTYLYPGGLLTQAATYNESGQMVRYTNPVYGLEGERRSTVGNTIAMTVTFDALYRVASVTDGSSHSTTYGYNQTGYLAQTTYPNGSTVQATAFDANGNMLTTIDRRGTTRTCVYNDPESRLTDIQFPNTPALNVHITWDAYGRRTNVSESTGQRNYFYDDNDAIVQADTKYTSLPIQSLIYSYYQDGSRSSLNTPVGRFTYQSDPNGRANALTNPQGETFAWTYLDNGWLWTQNNGNVTTAYYTYNALGQLTDLANRRNDQSNTLLSEFGSVVHDAVGNITNLTSMLYGVTAYSGTTAYNYNAKSQLSQETSQRLGGYSNGYNYDPVGNPTNFKGAVNTFNNVNQCTSNGTAYDGEGNPASWSGNALTYDANNKIVSIGNTLTAGYRSDGLRAWKQSSSGITYFIYDGSTPLYELTGAGVTQAVSTFGVNGLLSRHTSAGSVFYTFDAQSDVAQRLNSSGTILSSHCNDAFGSQASTVVTGDPYAGYGGQWGYYHDVETGLTLLSHRYYDASAGRFLTQDPIGYAGGSNLYAYAGNNTPNNTDPSGFIAWRNRYPFPGGINEPGIYGHANLTTDQPCDPKDPPGKDGCWSYGFWTGGADWQLPSMQGSSGSVGVGSSSVGNHSSSVSLLGEAIGSGSLGSGIISIGIGGGGLISGGIGIIVGIPGEVRHPDPRAGSPGAVTDPIPGSNNPAFMNALCDCISNSIQNPPDYRIGNVCGRLGLIR